MVGSIVHMNICTTITQFITRYVRFLESKIYSEVALKLGTYFQIYPSVSQLQIKDISRLIQVHSAQQPRKLFYEKINELSHKRN